VEILQKNSNDPYLEKLGLFKEGKLTKKGKLLLSLFDEAERL